MWTTYKNLVLNHLQAKQFLISHLILILQLNLVLFYLYCLYSINHLFFIFWTFYYFVAFFIIWLNIIKYLFIKKFIILLANIFKLRKNLHIISVNLFLFVSNWSEINLLKPLVIIISKFFEIILIIWRLRNFNSFVGRF